MVAKRNRDSKVIKLKRRQRKRRNAPVLCFYCLQAMSVGANDHMTVEHLQAKSLHGRNNIENLRLAHRSCNQAVGALPVSLKLKLAGKMKRGVLPDWLDEFVVDVLT